MKSPMTSTKTTTTVVPFCFIATAGIPVVAELPSGERLVARADADTLTTAGREPLVGRTITVTGTPPTYHLT